jgi:tape measure domain-containing protein
MSVTGANIRITGDESGLIRSLNQARQHASRFTREINSNVTQAYRRADAEQRAFRGGLTRLGGEIEGIGKKMTLFGALPTLFAAGKNYKDYTELQRMSKGLELYGESLDDVRRLAKEPNIGVYDGAKSLVGLRAVRLESSLAERAVKSFANAITGAGGNSTDLEPALFNLKQFKATQNINQVDLRQLANRIPQTMEVLEKAFGTTDVEKLNKLGIDKFIEGFVTELEKLPKVEGLAASAVEQLGDSFTFFSGTLGEGIDKAAGVTPKLLALGGALDNLATNFSSLTPEAQSAIVVLGGLAIAIPLVVTAVGTLIKLLPVTAMGFAGISWPIMGALALASAIGGLIALWPLLNNQMARYQQQQELVAGFAPKLDPLIAKYEDLKKSADPKEQKELQDVIKQISDLVPTAVTGWDKYGNAIDVNKSKVIEYTTEQKKLLTAMQDVRREQILSENRKSGFRKDELQKSLLTGSETKQVNLGMGVYQTQSKKLVPEDLKKYSAELSAINEKEKANRKELLSLGGQDLYLKETGQLKSLLSLKNKYEKEFNETRKKIDNGSYEERKANELKLVKLKGQVGKESLSKFGSSDIDKLIAAQRTKVALMVPEWNLAKQESRGDKTGVKGKPTTAPPPAGDDKPDKSLAKENHRRYLEILRDEKKELKDIRDITSGINRLEMIGSTIEKDRTLANMGAKAKAKTDALADRRMPQSLSDISRKFNQDPGVEIKKLGASMDLNDYFGGDLKLDDIRSHFDQIPGLLDGPVGEYQQRLNMFADATGRLKEFFGSKISLSEIRDFFAKIPQVAEESLPAYKERVNRYVDATLQLNQAMTSALQNAAVDLGTSFGELLGDVINSKEDPFANFGKNLKSGFGRFLTDIGKALITYSVVIEGLKKAIQTLKGPVALAAGILAIGAGKVLMNSANKAGKAVKLAKGGLAYGETLSVIGDNPGAQFNPEVVAPLDKLEGIINKGRRETDGSSGGYIPEVKLRGEDLYISFNRVKKRNEALGRG